MIVKLLTEHHLEFLSLQGGCTGSSESTLVKIPNCWKSGAVAQFHLISIVLLHQCQCYGKRHLIELAVILAYNIIMYFISFSNKHDCQKIVSY